MRLSVADAMRKLQNWVGEDRIPRPASAFRTTSGN